MLPPTLQTTSPQQSHGDSRPQTPPGVRNLSRPGRAGGPPQRGGIPQPKATSRATGTPNNIAPEGAESDVSVPTQRDKVMGLRAFKARRVFAGRIPGALTRAIVGLRLRRADGAAGSGECGGCVFTFAPDSRHSREMRFSLGLSGGERSRFRRTSGRCPKSEMHRASGSCCPTGRVAVRPSEATTSIRRPKGEKGPGEARRFANRAMVVDGDSNKFARASSSPVVCRVDSSPRRARLGKRLARRIARQVSPAAGRRHVPEEVGKGAIRQAPAGPELDMRGWVCCGWSRPGHGAQGWRCATGWSGDNQRRLCRSWSAARSEPVANRKQAP